MLITITDTKKEVTIDTKEEHVSEDLFNQYIDKAKGCFEDKELIYILWGKRDFGNIEDLKYEYLK